MKPLYAFAIGVVVTASLALGALNAKDFDWQCQVVQHGYGYFELKAGETSPHFEWFK